MIIKTSPNLNMGTVMVVMMLCFTVSCLQFKCIAYLSYLEYISLTFNKLNIETSDSNNIRNSQDYFTHLSNMIFNSEINDDSITL